MISWRIVATLIALAGPAAVHAQEDFPVVDWQPTIQTEAMISVMDQAAREGTGTRSRTTTRRSVAAQKSARARRQCAEARSGRYSADNPQLPRLLSLCDRAGY